MTKIVLGTNSDAECLDQLRAAHPSVEFVAASSNEAILREIADADAFYGIPTREQYLAAKKLRWIQTPIAGIDFLQHVPDLVESEVVLTNARGAHGATVAEHAFALLLALTRRLPRFAEARARHAWLPRGESRGVGLAGKTMGIVGFGTIGRAIARRARAFEMRVLGVDVQAVSPGEDAEDVWGLDRLPDLLRQTEVLAIAAPFTPETRGLIGAPEIGLLRPDAYLVAISRGGIVDEPALIRALQEGRLAGAGLDVTATEPLPPNDPLWEAPNLVLTPHRANASALTTELTWAIFAENVGRFATGKPLRNVTNKKLGY